MTLRCIVVEDEPLAVERLAGYIGRVATLELAGTFHDALDALAFLQENSIDLVFLDISLGSVSGIELLETSKLGCPVVLTTAHPEYALRAYQLAVVDYLLKPFTFQRFVEAVDRVRQRQSAAPADVPEFIFIKTESRLERIAVKDILYIEGRGDYRRIHTAQKRVMTLMTFGELEERLPVRAVCRVHKSYMVGLGKIESVERDRIKIADQLIPISATHRDRFYTLIGGLPR